MKENKMVIVSKKEKRYDAEAMEGNRKERRGRDGEKGRKGYGRVNVYSKWLPGRREL